MMTERARTKRSKTTFSGSLFQKIATSKTFQPERGVFRPKNRKITPMVGEPSLAAATNVKKQSPEFGKFRKAAMVLRHGMILSRVDEIQEYDRPASQLGPSGISGYKLSERGGGQKLMSEDSRGDPYGNDHTIGQD
jgi:hypothetical protein